MSDFDRYAAEIRHLQQARNAFPIAMVENGTRYAPPDDLSLTLVADVYFRLNRAYMAARRSESDHWSRPEKIAAISTLSVMLVHPIETSPDDLPAFYLNPLFALRCGFSRFGARFADLDRRTIERIAGWLDKFRVDSFASTFDVLHAARTAPFELKPDDAPLTLLHRELFDIDMLVSFYDVLKRLVDRMRPADRLA